MKLLTFKVNEAQEKELQILMEHEGYTNKTEFFRYLMKFYKIHQGVDTMSGNHRQSPVNTANNTTIKTTKSPINDENLSERKRKLLADPKIWDEGVRQLIRDMRDD